jgi:hypothetical protein
MIGSVNRNLVSVGSVLGLFGAGISRHVHAAVSAIDRVHKIPELAHAVPVVSDSAMTAGGKYRWDKETGRPRDIRLNPRSDHSELTTVLEIGHLLDHQVIGTAGEFASVSSALARSYPSLLANSDPLSRPEWAVWREATTCSWRAPNATAGQAPPLQAVSLPGRTRLALESEGVTYLWRG